MSMQAANDVATGVVAATAIASPLWLEKAQSISDLAEWTLAPLGAIWLIVQIIFKIKEYRRNGRAARKETTSSKE